MSGPPWQIFWPIPKADVSIIVLGVAMFITFHRIAFGVLLAIPALVGAMMYSEPVPQNLSKATVGGGDSAPTKSFAYLQGYKIYWGDMHGHSTLSNDWVGKGEDGDGHKCNRPASDDSCGPYDYFRNAIMNDLNFAVLTDHPESITLAQWNNAFGVAAAMKVENFFPFLGSELCRKTSDQFNCTNVIFSTVDGASYPLFSHESMTVTGDAIKIRENSEPTREDAWRRLTTDQQFEVLGIQVVPNTSASNLDWNFGPQERRALGCVEYASTGGRPWELDEKHRTLDIVLSGMRKGLVLCAVGSGNDHFSVPGRGPITGVLVRETGGKVSRREIWDAIKAGRTFAVFGPAAGAGSGPGREVSKAAYQNGKVPGYAERVKLSFEATIGGRTYLMGDKITLEGSDSSVVRFAIHVHKDNQKLRRVNVFRVREGNVADSIGCLSDSGSYDALEMSCSDTLEQGKSAAYFAVVYFRDETDSFDINPAQVWSSPILLIKK